MKIITNPPYCKNLHLKILSHLISLYPNAEIVNLSPIRWLQDPLAEYKKNSDWKKFGDIRKNIADLEVINATDMRAFFNSAQCENSGIYHITKNGDANILPKPFISQALFDKVNLPTYQGKYKSLYDVRSNDGEPDFSKPFVKLSSFQGNVGDTDCYNIISPQKDLAFSKSSKNKGWTINFDTQEEAENFFDYCQTKFVKACNGNVKTNIRWPGYAIPFMPTYTHPWTDEMLYEYFGLNEEEISIIENEMAQTA